MNPGLIAGGEWNLIRPPGSLWFLASGTLVFNLGFKMIGSFELRTNIGNGKPGRAGGELDGSRQTTPGDFEISLPPRRGGATGCREVARAAMQFPRPPRLFR